MMNTRWLGILCVGIGFWACSGTVETASSSGGGSAGAGGTPAGGSGGASIGGTAGSAGTEPMAGGAGEA
ncbi:MAG TPA: hypothetical protein PL065_20745, partial [Polyangiaceae bacterium]|nr:hypothetical protein [Polyangiaceae bacterium]